MADPSPHPLGHSNWQTPHPISSFSASPSPSYHFSFCCPSSASFSPPPSSPPCLATEPWLLAAHVRVPGVTWPMTTATTWWPLQPCMAKWGCCRSCCSKKDWRPAGSTGWVSVWGGTSVCSCVCVWRRGRAGGTLLAIPLTACPPRPIPPPGLPPLPPFPYSSTHNCPSPARPSYRPLPFPPPPQALTSSLVRQLQAAAQLGSHAVSVGCSRYCPQAHIVVVGKASEQVRLGMGGGYGGQRGAVSLGSGRRPSLPSRMTHGPSLTHT